MYVLILYISEIQQPNKETSAAAELRPALEQLQDAERGVLRSVRLLPLPPVQDRLLLPHGLPEVLNSL